MRLLIVSDMPHHRHPTHGFVGWGPTVIEIDHLATLFDEVVHVCFLYPGDAQPSDLPYSAPNLRVVPLRPSGGTSALAKLSVATHLVEYLAIVGRELDRADAVHVRCPSSVGLGTIALLGLRRRPVPRWIKYAGNWQPPGRDARAYRIQRRMLRAGLARSMVTVNGRRSDDPPFIRSFLNPCLTAEDLHEGRLAATRKSPTPPARLLFVGALNANKGILTALQIVATLVQRGHDVTFDVAGDGPLANASRTRAAALGIADRVTFHGAVPRTQLGARYAPAHFILLPTGSEGWPKVLSEAMAFGAVPVASGVGSVPEVLGRFGVGQALPAGQPSAFVAAIEAYLADPVRRRSESLAGVEAADHFSYERFLANVRELFAIAGHLQDAQ